MVTYDFICPNDHPVELSVEPGTKTVICHWCGETAEQVWKTFPGMRAEKAPVDMRNLLAGSPLEGSDGINRAHYRSDKPFADLGQRGSLEKRILDRSPEKVEDLGPPSGR